PGSEGRQDPDAGERRLNERRDEEGCRRQAREDRLDRPPHGPRSGGGRRRALEAVEGEDEDGEDERSGRRHVVGDERLLEPRGAPPGGDQEGGADRQEPDSSPAQQERILRVFAPAGEDERQERDEQDPAEGRGPGNRGDDADLERMAEDDEKEGPDHPP